MKKISLTEDRLTTEDITKRIYQIWFLLPLCFFVIVYFIHLVVFWINCDVDPTIEQVVKLMFYLQAPGDNLYQYLHLTGYASVLCELIGVFSIVVIKKENKDIFKSLNVTILCFVLFCILMIASTVINKTNIDYITGYQQRGEGILNFLCYFLVIYLTGTFIKKEKYKELIAILFLILDIVVALIVLYDIFIDDVPFLYFKGGGVCAIFYNRNFYGYFLSIATMLSLACFALTKNNIKRIIYFLVFALNCVLTNMCDTMGCFLATLVGVFYLLIMIAIRDKKISWFTIFGFVTFLIINGFASPYYADYYSQLIGMVSQIFGIDTQSVSNSIGIAVQTDVDTGRLELWRETIKLIKQKPVIGWGMDGIYEILDALTEKGMPHNEYLEYTAYFGIPAGLLYITGLAAIYIRGIKWNKYLDDATLVCMTGAFGYAVSAFFGNTMYFLAPFFFIFLGLSTIHKDKEDEFVKLEKYRNSKDSEDLARSYISDVINMQSYAAVQDGNEMEA